MISRRTDCFEYAPVRSRSSRAWRPRIALLPLAAILAGSLALAAPQQEPACPNSPASTTDPETFGHRWAGLVFTLFTLDGEEVWAGEDGGRIRHRNPSNGVWSFQQVPLEVQGVIRKIHFHSNLLDGWAVSSDGWVLRTDDGGDEWLPLTRFRHSFDWQEWEDLFSIWMDSNKLDGILVGAQGIWYTDDGGVCWERAVMSYGTHLPWDESTFANAKIELWSLDVQVGTDHEVCPPLTGESEFLGLVVGRPGYILRSTDLGRNWVTVLRGEVDLDGPVAGTCLEAATISGGSTNTFKFWDVAISNNETDPLALVVGGLGTQCGLVLASEDNGCTWVMELHECEAPNPNQDCTNVPGPYAGSPRRHIDYKTLYGVSIYDDTNEALAVGYNGQQVRRQVSGSPAVAQWVDRSEFGPITDAPDDVVIFPLWCVTAVQASATPQYDGWLSGVGGHIRRSDDRGETWEHEALGEPFRTNAVFFRPVTGEDDEGWIVGQGYRVAWSEDGGASWDEMDPTPVWAAGCQLNDIIFAGDLEHGVTVGCRKPVVPPTVGAGPKILYTAAFDTTEWQDPTSVSYTLNGSHYLNNGRLLRVAWGGNSNLEFWAVGMDGLILRTTDGGDNWSQVNVPLSSPDDPLDFDIHGVAGTNGSYATFVGQHQGQAMAWIHNPSLPSWLNVTPADTSITILSDVALDGTTPYAVGQRDLGGGEVEGIVLKFNAFASPPAFEEIAGPFDPDGVPECAAGDSALAAQGIRTLSRIAVDPDGNLWIGGLCGRIWELPDSSSNWVEHKSQTGTDVRCLQFLTGDRGYLAGHSSNEIQQVLVRLQR